MQEITWFANRFQSSNPPLWTENTEKKIWEQALSKRKAREIAEEVALIELVHQKPDQPTEFYARTLNRPLGDVLSTLNQYRQDGVVQRTGTNQPYGYLWRLKSVKRPTTTQTGPLSDPSDDGTRRP